MAERLTYRDYEQIGIKDLDVYGIGEKNADALDNAARKLYEYEEKEEQGLLIELPCKIGSIVYFIDEEWRGFNGEWDTIDVIQKIKFTYSMIPYIGSSYYLTYEEADSVLKDRNAII
jgi:hypothetical protein